MTDAILIDSREQYLSLLKANTCTVTFTKVNGDTRVMKCTLNPAFIPQLQIPASLEEKVERSLEVIRVFDTEAQGWRSFRVDSVTDFRAGA